MQKIYLQVAMPLVGGTEPREAYWADEADKRMAELEALLRRVIEWEPAMPVEASLADEIAAALQHQPASEKTVP